MKTMLLLGLALACLSTAPSSQAGTGGFKAGDFYLHEVAWSGISSLDGGILHIDPLSGAVTLLHDLATSGPGVQMMCYDPWRDRILFFGGFTPNSIELYASDAAGNLQSLGMQTASGGSRGLLTSRGDGIVYLLNPLNSNVLSYVDAANQVQVLLNAAGTGPWDFVLPDGQIQSLLYVPKTNSLVATLYSFALPCPGIPTDVTSIHRLDLSADGTRVVAETCFWYDSNPADWDGETRGLTLGPNGDPILVIGNGGSGSGSQGRIATIDLATSSASAFATVDFFAQHRIVGGVYSHVRGQAVVHDSFADALRAYSPGGTGGGTLFSGGLSASSSSGESACLVEVTPVSSLTGLTSNTSSASLSGPGSQVLSIDVGPAFAGSLYLALGSLSGWTPGTPYGGAVVPLNWDAYLQLVLDNPNQIPLLNSLNTLDPLGRSTVTFQLPAGSNPAWAGLVLHHAAIVLGPTLTVDRVTNAVPVELVP